jgi:hypothetical protein
MSVDVLILKRARGGVLAETHGDGRVDEYPLWTPAELHALVERCQLFTTLPLDEREGR